MSKKLLEMLCVFGLCSCLFTVSNITENYSFTTESDEIQSPNETDQNNLVDNRSAKEGMGLTAGITKFTEEVLSEEVLAGAGTEEAVTAQVPQESESSNTNENGISEDNSAKAIENVAEAPANRWNITLTEEEMNLLAKIVWTEARGEGEEGEKAVVECVFNRMVSTQYPDTLYDVLSQQNPTQFCSWKKRNQAEPTETEYRVIREVLEGKTNILRNDTMYFSTTMQTENLDTKIGNHYFCY